MIRAVIDTNVLVSAMISSTGNEALVVLAVHQGLITPCLCADIVQEYSDVLQRPKFGFSGHEVDALLGLLRQRGVFVNAVCPARVSPDPGDDKFIACALEAKSNFLVTGNQRHFPKSSLPGIRVVSAKELLEFIALAM